MYTMDKWLRLKSMREIAICFLTVTSSEILSTASTGAGKGFQWSQIPRSPSHLVDTVSHTKKAHAVGKKFVILDFWGIFSTCSGVKHQLKYCVLDQSITDLIGLDFGLSCFFFGWDDLGEANAVTSWSLVESTSCQYFIRSDYRPKDNISEPCARSLIFSIRDL